MAEAATSARMGALAAVAAFVWWGLSVIFFTWQAHIPAYEVLAHRVFWSVVFVGAYLLWQRRGPEIREVWRDRPLRHGLLLSGVVVGLNWLIFVWAVGQGHILETSYGYFINPIVVVFLSYLILREHLSRWQWAAVAVAMAAVAIQGLLLSSFPWVALSLTATFAFYGLLKKRLAVGANMGLLIEALWLLPLALAYLAYLSLSGQGHFASTWQNTLLLICNGPVTAVPLILFAYAARRLRYSTVGLCQYITPSLSFLIAVYLYGEPLNPIKLLSFMLIWLSLALFSWDLVRRAKADRLAGGG